MNDQKQRDKALDLSSSFIVQAPAGSGKTELITQRYLKLLGTADEPENILVMTFTNRAVDELKHRIISSLNRAKKKPPLEKYQRKTYDLPARVFLPEKHSSLYGPVTYLNGFLQLQTATAPYLQKYTKPLHH